MYPIYPETLPVSEYYRPIYQPLPLNHLETPSPSRFPPSFSWRGKEGREREEENERGAPPPPLVQFGLPWGGAATPCGLPLLSPMDHEAHYFPQGVPVTSRYSGKYPKRPGTIPVSEYHLPIYQSLPLDHSETPRHVRDLIRYSEQSSVTKTHNS